MIKIGITGSISSGKSTVSKFLSENKHPIFNADKSVAHIYKQNSFKKKIIKIFKIQDKQNIKREIKKILFKDNKSLKKLEQILHPQVRKKRAIFVKKNKNKKILIFEIPLLIESKLMKDYDIIILVKSKKKIRLNRYLKKKNNKDLFNLLDRKQMGPNKKTKYSNYVINNNSSIEELKKKVNIIKNKYA